MTSQNLLQKSVGKCVAKNEKLFAIQLSVARYSMITEQSGLSGLKVHCICFTCLKPKARGQNERSDARDESCEERVKGEGSNETAVHKLHDPREEDIHEIGVDDLQAFWGVVQVPRIGHFNK